MASDTIITTASMPNSKDFAKKKRANRSAKLKQCKRDARREQWLSQVKNKECKEWKDEVGREQGRGGNGVGKLDSGSSKDGDNEGSVNHRDSYYESPPNSPVSHTVAGGNDSGTNYMGSDSSSSSNSGGSCVGSCTEEEEGNDDCLDDWEAMADSLAADDKDETASFDPTPGCESMGGFNLSNMARNWLGVDRQNSEANCVKWATRAAFGNNRAWRPDDAFRPQTLPTLSKQYSFPTTDKHYVNGGIPCQWPCGVKSPTPSSCPICYEDLDTTDSSFLPCLCGFRLCLFCHKRILDDDGRCPGCRKPYEQSQVETESITHGGSLGFRLTRSYSMSTSA